MTAGGWTIRRTPSGVRSGVVGDLATSFELHAAEYARLRPGYPGAALDAIARILRPGGTPAMLWKHDDEADPRVHVVEAALDRVGRPAGGTTGLGAQGSNPGGDPGGDPGDDPSAAPPEPPFHGHPLFDGPEVSVIRWQRSMSVEDFSALQHTYSYVIRASAALQAQLDRELPLTIREHVSDAATVSVPVICQVWRSVRR